MSRRVRLIAALVRAYDAGALSLDGVCPHCFQQMSYFDHGKCPHCKRGCGCSFNPVSSSDHCDMHGQQGEFKRRKAAAQEGK